MEPHLLPLALLASPYVMSSAWYCEICSLSFPSCPSELCPTVTRWKSFMYGTPTALQGNTVSQKCSIVVYHILVGVLFFPSDKCIQIR